MVALMMVLFPVIANSFHHRASRRTQPSFLQPRHCDYKANAGAPPNSKNDGPIQLAKTVTLLNLAPQQLGSFEGLQEFTETKQKGKRKVICEDLVSANAQRVDFQESWDWQKQLMQEHFDRIAASASANSLETTTTNFLDENIAKTIDFMDSTAPLPSGGIDTIFMLEHEAIYTLVRLATSNRK